MELKRVDGDDGNLMPSPSEGAMLERKFVVAAERLHEQEDVTALSPAALESCCCLTLAPPNNLPNRLIVPF